MKKQCPQCGKICDPRGFHTHLASHNRVVASESNDDPIARLTRLEQQTQSAIADLRKHRETLAAQTSQIDALLDRYPTPNRAEAIGIAG